MLGLLIGMNRRSWVMLLDFFGLLGRDGGNTARQLSLNNRPENVGQNMFDGTPRKGLKDPLIFFKFFR